MKYEILSLALVMAMTVLSCSKTEQENDKTGSDIPKELPDLPDTIRIGSYNMRVTVDPGTNAWKERKHRLVESIMENDFDIFGVQEADITIQSELPKLLSDAGADYSYRFFSPYDQSGNGNKAQGIIYKKDAFSIEDWNFYWVSDTPDESTINDIGPKGNHRIGACCATVRDLRRKDIRFFLMVSHGHLNEATNTKYAYVYEEQEKRYNTEGLPSIFVGDLNATPTSSTSALLRQYWTDSYMFLPNDKKSGPAGTYNGYDHDKNMETARRIDYIYFRGGGLEPLNYVCNDALYDEEFASDHFPVYVDMKIEKTVIWY